MKENSSKTKRPQCDLGGIVVHGRSMLHGSSTGERGYFTRDSGFGAKLEVRS